MKPTFKILFLLIFCLQELYGQNQNTDPIISVRRISSSPTFEDYNPLISIYENGNVIFKVGQKDYCNSNKYFCDNYYISGVSLKMVDSIYNSINFLAFDTLKTIYNPYQSKFQNHTISDVGFFIISVNTDKINKSIWIYDDWVKSDTNFNHNPKELKILFDWAMNLREQLIKTKKLILWQPSRIELCRRELAKADDINKHYLKLQPYVNIPNSFKTKKWENVPDQERLEYIQIENSNEIKQLIELLFNKWSRTKFDKKNYSLFYTFCYDLKPFDWYALRQN